MHIGILSFQPLSKRLPYQDRRLAEEAKKMGHRVTTIRIQRCVLTFDGHGAIGVQHKSRPLPKFDVVIPRVSATENVPVRSAIVEQIRLMGIPMLNDYEAINKAKSKLSTLQILSHYNIPVVKTAVLHTISGLDEAVKHLGTFPMIIKTVFGSFGNGVTIVESARAAKSTYGLIAEQFSSKNGLLLQEYISEADGKDIRIFIVGGKMIASMQRKAMDGDFRSNVGQGGTGMIYEPSRKEINIAIRATKALGLEVSGVDIIHTKHGPAVMEVNGNPFFEELEKTTGVNVAGAIIKYARRYVNEFVG